MRVLFALLFIVFLSGCSDSYSEVVSFQMNAQKSGSQNDTVITEDAVKFLRRRDPESRALQINWSVPAEHEGKATWMVAEGTVRSNLPLTRSNITFVGFRNKNEIKIWKAIFLRPHYLTINKWSTFRDSIFVPAEYDGCTEFSVWANSGDAHSEIFDVQNLKVKFIVLQ